MQRYFADIIDNKVILNDGDIHHFSIVMRAKVGDEIEVVADKKLYLAKAISFNPLTIEVVKELENDSEIGKEITLFFCLAKGDKIEFVIQKATEIGASKVVLIKSERCVTKMDNDDFKRKAERYKKIAKEASEQSHRIIVPEIVGVFDINKIPESLLCELNFVAYEKNAGNTTKSFEEINKDCQSVSILIGPEGGLSLKEVDTLINKYYFIPTSLGKRILRTETAAINALSVIAYLLEK